MALLFSNVLSMSSIAVSLKNEEWKSLSGATISVFCLHIIFFFILIYILKTDTFIPGFYDA